MFQLIDILSLNTHTQKIRTYQKHFYITTFRVPVNEFN